MEKLQRINELDVEIAEQAAIVRFAGYKYIYGFVAKLVSWLVLIIGFSFPSQINIFLIIFGIIGLFFSKEKTTFKELQTEERRLIELQTQRSALWVEMMSAQVH